MTPQLKGSPLPHLSPEQRLPWLLLSSSSLPFLPGAAHLPLTPSTAFPQETVFRNPLYLVQDKSVMENLEPSVAPDPSENPEQPQATLTPGLLPPGLQPCGASRLEQPSMS